VDWFATIVVNSVDLIETYVRERVSASASPSMSPASKIQAGLKHLPLADFDPVPIGRPSWRGKATPSHQKHLSPK